MIDQTHETVEEFLARGGIVRQFKENKSAAKSFEGLKMPPTPRFVVKRTRRVIVNRVSHHSPIGYASMSWGKMK